MSVNNKRVFYVKYLAHEIYTDILRKRPDVRLDRLENESAEAISAPILVIVSSNGAGYDPVDVEACTEAGVLVVNQSGGNANSVAEHALGMLLTLSKRILEADRALRRDPNVNRNALIGTEAQGKTIGIVGLGNVGRRIAELCNGLLGMKVLAYDPYLDATEMAARGFIHDETALVEALRDKRIAGAGLDVWAKEPPPSDHPLLQFDNVLASPHTAGVTKEARANMGRIAAEQILDALDGKRP